MNDQMRMLTCTMCGHRFDPADQASCQGCPLQRGCSMARCPQCGFENANPDRSHLAQLFRRAFGRRSTIPPSSLSRSTPS